MTKKCLGCGSVLQTDNSLKEGYISKDAYSNAILCQRCFRIKNYGDYQIINNDNKYQEIFDEVKKKDDLILYLCDILNIDESIERLNGFKGPVILVITKKDILPKSVKENKLMDYIKTNYKLDVKSIIFVCSIKNYNLDLLMNLVNKYKKSNNVYFVGNTNAGKSTLINTLIKSYSDKESYITTSFLPATTQDVIKIKLNDNCTFIDTPGLVNSDSFLYNEKPSIVKAISEKKEIKPRTYQMKPNESLLIGDYVRIDYVSNTNNSFTLYLANSIKVQRIKLNTNDKLRNLNKTSFSLDSSKDIVINGFGFCKITKSAEVDVYTKDTVKVYERNNLI